MRRQGLYIGLMAVVMFAVVACAQSIHRVDSSNYGYAARDDLKVSELQPVVENAASGKGWKLSGVQTGSFTGMREWGGGKHSVVVDVSYNPKGFSISYKDSQGLTYTGTTIHHSYNEFVIQLENAIKAAVSLL